MAECNFGFCELEEYTSHVEQLILPNKLAIGGLHVVMFRLHEREPYPAIMLPATVVNRSAYGGRYFVRYLIKDADLQPDGMMDSMFMGGFTDPWSGSLQRDGMQIVEGYFRPYDEDDDGLDLPELADELHIPTSRVPSLV